MRVIAERIGSFHPNGIGSQLDGDVFKEVSVLIQGWFFLINLHPGHTAFVGGNPPYSYIFFGFNNFYSPSD